MGHQGDSRLEREIWREKFVMISTDKAVNPTNVMGCSKRICEIYVQSLDKAIKDGKIKGVTQFVTTRFGNVLGSNGSVIPLFRKQLAAGGPLTVTHPKIIRYFMLIHEACKLVLEAGTHGKGGEIFVFDMGEPVRIADLAQRMIKLSGATNVEIKYTGLREGEKLYEEVLNENENTLPSFHPKYALPWCATTSTTRLSASLRSCATLPPATTTWTPCANETNRARICKQALTLRGAGRAKQRITTINMAVGKKQIIAVR